MQLLITCISSLIGVTHYMFPGFFPGIGRKLMEPGSLKILLLIETSVIIFLMIKELH